jgi:hypothetical protein
MSGKDSKARRVPGGATHSDIIRYATIYVQSMAAFHAGFKADATGNFAYAGSHRSQPGGRQLHKAKKALRKLIAISPARVAGRPPLTREELHAKAAVLAVVTQQMEHSEPTKLERVLVSLFAQETTDWLASFSKGANDEH